MQWREFIRLLRSVTGALLLVSVSLAGSFAAEPLSRSVLIIDQYGPGLPFSAGISAGIRAAVISGSATQVSVYHELLDVARFRGSDYEHSLNAHFRVKYRDKQVGVIIAVGSAALEYVLRSRAELWPEVPVVFTTLRAGAPSQESSMTHPLIPQLKQRKSALKSESEAIIRRAEVAGRGLSSNESRSFDANVATIKEIDERIAQLEGDAERESAAAGFRATMGGSSHYSPARTSSRDMYAAERTDVSFFRDLVDLCPRRHQSRRSGSPRTTTPSARPAPVT